MDDLFFKLDENNPDKDSIKKCAEIIKSGGIVIFPTETVYGIGTNAFDDEALLRLYRAKKRPLSKPFLCHINGLEQAEKLALVDNTARKLILKYTPGPLTLVLKKKKCVSDILTSNGDTVGLRFPENNIFIQLSKFCSCPIAATSANISGFESAKDSDDLKSLFNIADAVIDAGKCRYSLESTILSLAGEPKILRQGSFPREIIEEEIGKCV